MKTHKAEQPKAEPAPAKCAPSAHNFHPSPTGKGPKVCHQCGMVQFSKEHADQLGTVKGK